MPSFSDLIIVCGAYDIYRFHPAVSYCLYGDCSHRETHDGKVYTQRYPDFHFALKGTAHDAYLIELVHVLINSRSFQHLFASFLSRDQAYDQLVDIWHVAHPNLSSRTLKAKVAGRDDDDANADNDKDESGSETDETDEYGSDYDSDDYTEMSEEEEEEAGEYLYDCH